MILLILMQRPKQEGLGAAFGAGVTDQVFGARTSNVLQRGTVYLATAFFLVSLALSALKVKAHQGVKTADLLKKEQQATAPVAEPKPEVVPDARPKSLSEQLPTETAPKAEEKPAETAPKAPEKPAETAPKAEEKPAGQ